MNLKNKTFYIFLLDVVRVEHSLFQLDSGLAETLDITSLITVSMT